MTYGSLTAIVGPMYAGKTTEVLKRVLWAQHGEQKRVLTIKPSFDNRYAETEIVSHDGLRTTALSIREWGDALAHVVESDFVFVDEVQFFDAPHFPDDLPSIARNLLRAGKTLVVSGLDMDWQGTPFPVTSAMIAMADEVIKLRANCTVCGRPAHKTYKKKATDGVSVELGAQELYESRCNVHWQRRDL